MPTYKNNTNESVMVEDIHGNNAVVPPGFYVETYKYMDSVLTRTADTPYFPLAKINDSVSVSGTGSISGLLDCKILRLTASSSGMAVKVDSASNTFTMPLISNQPMDIENNGEINTLHFTGSGTVGVVGF